MNQGLNIKGRAHLFAQEKHKGQKDDTGADYFHSHVQQVYHILSVIIDDENLLCAAYLHDTIEDTDTTYAELVSEFNEEIANLVMEVTHEGKKDQYGYYFPRLKSQKAIVLKFADRLSNVSRMEAWDEDRRKQYLRKSKFWKDGSDL